MLSVTERHDLSINDLVKVTKAAIVENVPDLIMISRVHLRVILCGLLPYLTAILFRP